MKLPGESACVRQRRSAKPLHGASRIGVDARVMALDPHGDSKAGDQQREPVRPAFSQSAAPRL
jgi:hypothetical protein